MNGIKSVDRDVTTPSRHRVEERGSKIFPVRLVTADLSAVNLVADVGEIDSIVWRRADECTRTEGELKRLSPRA